MRRLRKKLVRQNVISRAGSASLDYVLILGVILPMVAFMILNGRVIMRLAYEMVCAMIAWPFM